MSTAASASTGGEPGYDLDTYAISSTALAQ